MELSLIWNLLYVREELVECPLKTFHTPSSYFKPMALAHANAHAALWLKTSCSMNSIRWAQSWATLDPMKLSEEKPARVMNLGGRI